MYSLCPKLWSRRFLIIKKATKNKILVAFKNFCLNQLLKVAVATPFCHLILKLSGFTS